MAGRSKYREAQIRAIKELLPLTMTANARHIVAEKMYDSGIRKTNMLALTLHALIGTWRLFFFGAVAALMYTLVFVREEMDVNPWFVVIPAIISAALLLMIGECYLYAKRTLKK